jgi:hypothetical protein
VPSLSASIILTLIGLIFGAGVSWGIFKLTIGRTAEELKQAVSDLKTVNTRLVQQEERSKITAEVTKDHEERLRTVELKLASMAN